MVCDAEVLLCSESILINFVSDLYNWPLKRSSIVDCESSLVYPITLQVIDDFTTTPFHLVLSSAAVVELGICASNNKLCNTLWLKLALIVVI